MICSMSVWIIDLPLHYSIYVICSLCATLVLVLARARARLHVYVHIAPYAHFGSIVGVSLVLDCYMQLGLVCDAHSANFHVIVGLERKSLLYPVLFMSEYLCMNSCVNICRWASNIISSFIRVLWLSVVMHI